MVKILFENEEGLLEIIFSDRIYVDPDAPTDILINVEDYGIRIRIRFTDVEEVSSFMNILFECDKINLKEIADDNPELTVTIEEMEINDVYSAMNESLAAYLEQLESGEYDDEEE